MIYQTTFVKQSDLILDCRAEENVCRYTASSLCIDTFDLRILSSISVKLCAFASLQFEI